MSPPLLAPSVRIGVVGAGRIGATAAGHFVDAGHEVRVANSRGPETLTDLVADLGRRASAGTPAEAGRFGDVVLEAIPFAAYRELPADALAGTTVISASNYWPDRDGDVEFDGRSHTELVAAHLADSRVVKSFNTMRWERLRDEARPDAPRDERLSLYVAGDDPEAKATVADLVDEVGFAPVDVGSLADGERIQPGSPVFNEPLTPAAARSRLGLD
jgi:predicted dinucleotide-binding enzyme